MLGYYPSYQDDGDVSEKVYEHTLAERKYYILEYCTTNGNFEINDFYSL